MMDNPPASGSVSHQMSSLDHIIDYRRINPGHYNTPQKWERLCRSAIRVTKLTNGTLIHESNCKDCKRKLLRLVCIFRFSDAALVARKDTCKYCGKELVRQVTPSTGQEAELLRHKLESLDWNQTLELARNGRVGLAGLSMLRRGSLQAENLPGMERKASSKALLEAAEALSEVVQEAADAEEELSMLPPGMIKKFTLLDQLKEDEPRIQLLMEEIREKNRLLYNLPGPLPIDDTDAAIKIAEAEVRDNKNFRRHRKGVGLPPAPSKKELDTVTERRFSTSSWESGMSGYDSRFSSRINSRQGSNFTTTPHRSPRSNRTSRNNSIEPSDSGSPTASKIRVGVLDTVMPSPEEESPDQPPSENELAPDMLLKEALGIHGPRNRRGTLQPVPGSAPASDSPVPRHNAFEDEGRARTREKAPSPIAKGPGIVTAHTVQLSLPQAHEHVAVTSSLVNRGPGFAADVSLALFGHSPLNARRLSKQLLEEEVAGRTGVGRKKSAAAHGPHSAVNDTVTVNILRKVSTGNFMQMQQQQGNGPPRLFRDNSGGSAGLGWGEQSGRGSAGLGWGEQSKHGQRESIGMARVPSGGTALVREEKEAGARKGGKEGKEGREGREQASEVTPGQRLLMGHLTGAGAGFGMGMGGERRGKGEVTLDPGKVSQQVEDEVAEARASDPLFNLKAELRRAGHGAGHQGGPGRRTGHGHGHNLPVTVNGHGAGPPGQASNLNGHREHGGGSGVLPVNSPHLRRKMRDKVKGHAQNLSSGIQGGGIRQQPRPGQSPSFPGPSAGMHKTELVMANSVLQLPSLSAARVPSSGRHGVVGGHPGHASNPNPPSWKLMHAPMVKAASAEGGWGPRHGNGGLGARSM